MNRSKWKGSFIDLAVFRKFSNKKILPKIWSRRSVIPSKFVGQTVLVYTGNTFKRFFVDRRKVGFKFGSFCFTRLYNIKKKSKSNNKAKNNT